MRKPRLLDLFAGAGGAGFGYGLAGFDVVCVDNVRQPANPLPFVQADAFAYLEAHGREFDAIHASPPCQAHTALGTMPNTHEHEDLIPATRSALERLGKPYIIENVEGAPLIDPVTLCGTMFGLGVPGKAELWRHRLFESNVPLLAPTCRHGREDAVIGIYGGHVRNRTRRPGSVDRGVADFTPDEGRRAMGIAWMSIAALSQAIPPAYTRFLGRQLLTHLELTGALVSSAEREAA